ncbi:MAG: DUF3313 family protein [Pseudomonadota bacterium]
MRTILFASVALALAACATGVTGPDAASRFDRFTVVTTKDFTGYERVHIPRPAVGPDVQERIGARTRGIRNDVRPLGQRDVDAMVDRLHRDMQSAVGEVVTLVEAPGPGVLTIKTTVIDLDSNRPTQQELALEPSLSLQSLYAGESSIEFEFLENGELLAEARDTDNVVSLQDQAIIGAGIWTTAQQHFRQVSNKLAALLAR